MDASTITTAPRGHRYLPDVPRWARLAARAIALCTIPSAIWRIGIVAQVPAGYDQSWIHRSQLDTVFGGFRMVLLCVVSELLALLAFGLVQRWGEVMPSWVPGLGGKWIPAWLPVVLATIGGIGLTMIWTIGVVYAVVSGATFDHEAQPGLPNTVQQVAYAPMIVWGPLLLSLAVHYRLRRRLLHPAARDDTTDQPSATLTRK